MTEPAHLTEEQVARYRDGNASPAELLTIDEHLSACASCRDRLYNEQAASRRLRALRADLTGHLEYPDVVACAEGRATPEQAAHLKDCGMCREEVADLARFRAELAPKRSWTLPLGIAASVLLVAGAAMWSARRPQPEAPVRFERAAVLDSLAGSRGTLLGAQGATAAFGPLSPAGMTVLTDRPILRWTPLAGATGYVVTIYDESFRKVAGSPLLTATGWQPETPLPRGVTLMWQVTARTPKGEVNSPAPPEPEARFQVVPAEVAQRIENARQESPLKVAEMMVEAGALDDAEKQLERLDPVKARPYIESLERMRAK